jgi:hypothetical protein
MILDPMHLVYLGVVKRMLRRLVKKCPRAIKLSAQKVNELDVALGKLKLSMPSEFVRRPRSTVDLKLWKATEYRAFLLYIGPVVLRRIVPPDVYKHFCRLHVAITILSDSDVDKRNMYLEYARGLLLAFVQDCKHVYGNSFTVYNIHFALH